MKKLLSLLLALCLLLGSLSALAEALPQEEDAAAGLPKVGDVVEGFEVKAIRPYAQIGATVVLFEHQKTGAGLTYIANNDVNRMFDLTFMTQPIDNTGLPHVFEHATLSGSEKYPSDELFMNLSAQTYNTFMNAMTYSMMTTYPVSSLSELQLLRYADYYTDSCLHPMIMQDESIYRTEAWRYRLPSADADLTIEGTVYSEMLGALSLERCAAINNMRAAFPGSFTGFEHGGEPEFIPDMSWDDLKSYHDLYYHPSNCMAYLYGSFEDYTAFLRLLDEAFSPYERRIFSHEDVNYTPITEPVTVEFPYAAAAGTSTEHTATVYYTIVCPGLKGNAEESLVLNTLTDLLTDSASPMQQALKKALPYGRFSAHIETTAGDYAIVFTATNVNREDAETFRATVDSVLVTVSEDGFAQDMVDSVMTTVDLSNRLAVEDSDLNQTVVMNMAYCYVTSGDPFDYINYVEGLERMDEWNREGVYQAAVKKWLVGSRTTALSTTYNEPGLREQKDAALAERLAGVKAAMSPEEIEALVADSNAEHVTGDASEYVRQLQAVTVASLPEEIREYEVADVTGEDGVRRMDAKAGVDGVGQAVLFLDAAAVPQEDVQWFQLFIELVGRLDTTSHTREEMDVLTGRYLNGLEVRASLMNDAEYGVHPYLRMGFIGLERDLPMSYQVLYELVFETDFTNVEDLTGQVTAVRTQLRTDINATGHTIALYRAISATNPLYRYLTYSRYLEHYAFLEETERMLAEDPQSVVAHLQAMQTFLRNRWGAIALYAGSEEGIALNRPEADAFLAKLDSAERERVRYEFPALPASEAIILDVNVNFNAQAAPFAALGLDGYDAGMDAVTALVADAWLLPLLRDQYGAYGAYAGAFEDHGFYLFTYRDPNVAESYGVFAQLGDDLENTEFTQETLDGYILSAYANYAKPQGELTGATSWAVNILDGKDPARALTFMRQLKAVTPETVRSYAPAFRALAESGNRVSVGGAGTLAGNEAFFEQTLNPFNMQAAPQVALADLTDVPEGSEHYEGVSFLFENGLMAPVSETEFGVDEPTTLGDLCGVLCAMAGLPDDPASAVPLLASIGIVPEGAAADTPLTGALADTTLVNFGSLGLGAPIAAVFGAEKADTAVTRGELGDAILTAFAPYLQ